MFGRLPWFAFDRRIFAFFFFVFFDMAVEAICQAPPAHWSSSSADHLLITRSSGTSHSAARLQPCGCHSSWPVAWASVSIEKKHP